jgi:cytochrome c oxidase subunit 1
VAAIITFSAQALFAFNFFYSMFRGRLAPANPWNSTTLEWTTPRFPGHGNWIGRIPYVYRWAYDYSKPNADKDGFTDFIPQHIPLSQTPSSNSAYENELKEIQEKDEVIVHEQKA